MNNSINYKGANLYYQISGKKDGKVLVLLHGGFGSTSDFDNILPMLSKNFYVIAIDSRAHGHSTLGDVPLTYAQIAEDIEYILKELKIENFNILGFSDGGIVAYKMAISGIKIDKIITIGASFEMNEDYDIFPIFKNLTIDFISEKLPKKYKEYKEKNPKPNIEKFFSGVKGMWLDLTNKGYPKKEEIKSIKNPILAIRGDNDFLFSFKDILKLKEYLPNVNIMNVPFASHEVLEDYSSLVYPSIKYFLLK